MRKATGIERITVEGMSPALPAYSLATAIDPCAGRLIETAGQIGLDANNEMVEGGAVAQTHQIMANLGAILAAAGATYDNVTRTAMYIDKQVEDELGLISATYKGYFDQDALPVRTTIFVAGLPFGALVELDMRAFVPHQGPQA